MEKPNILWIHTDQQRSESIGCYGQKWAKTPNFDNLAAEGTLFENAFCQSPVCAPSRTSQLTGAYPLETGVLNNEHAGFELPEKFIPIGVLLEKAGYLSGTFGKQHVSKGRFWSEEEFIIAANEYVSHFELIGPYTGKDEEYDILNTPGNPGHILGGIYPEKEDCATRCIDSGYKFIEKAQEEEQPFFLRLNIEWPHAPILAPRPFDTLYDPKDLPIRYFDEEKDIKGRSDFDLAWTKKYSDFTSSKENVDKHWRYYMGSVAYLDSQIGKVLEYLKDNDLRENTIIVFSSDHGHMMGERGVMEKGGFDRNSLSVPFIWSWPGHIPKGKRVKDLTELIDLPRTLLSLCGLSDLTPSNYRGRDLFSEEQAPDKIFSQIDLNIPELDQFRYAVQTSDWRLDITYCYDGRELTLEERDGNLFDLKNDKYEEANQFYNPAFKEIRRELLKSIDDNFKSFEMDPRLLDNAYNAHQEVWHAITEYRERHKND